jgi:hypothetical protein
MNMPCTCTCGHPIEDHDGPGGCCSVEECACAGYEEEDPNDTDKLMKEMRG